MTIQTISEVFTAGESKPFQLPGRFFRLMQTTGPVDVSFYRNNSHVGDALQVEAGFAWSVDTGEQAQLFDRIVIKSASGQTVKFGASEHEIRYDRSSGSVDVQSFKNAAAFSHLAPTVTGADAQLFAANATRRVLSLKNTGSVTVYLRFDGVAADANGYPLDAGGSLLLDVCAPSGAIRAFSATPGSVVGFEA